MSVAVKGRIRSRSVPQKCASRLRRLFPHLLLCLSLVGYAALGALMFKNIEGGSPSSTEKEYFQFLGGIVTKIQNLTSK